VVIIMYIDERLIEAVKYHSINQINENNIKEYIDKKGVLYTFEEAKEDMELNNMEEVMDNFFIIVDNEKVKFIGDEILDEWVLI